jgi:hypothetical protein
MSETQVAPRAERVEIEVQVERAETLPAGTYEAVNISKGGLCLQASVPEQIGGFVAVKFPLNGVEISVYAEVIWCKKDPSASASAHRIGLRFVVIGQREQQVIEDFVASQIPNAS